MSKVIKSSERVITDNDQVKITEISELIELRSKLEKGKNEVKLKVKLKDLPEGSKVEDLIAAIEVNTRIEEKKCEEKKEKPKFKAKYLIPIIVPILLFAGIAKSCSRPSPDQPLPDDHLPDTPDTDQVITLEPEFETSTDIFNKTFYNPDNPYVLLESLTNAAGQEGMTANAIEGNVWSGAHYDSNQQFEDEKVSSEGQQNFEQMTQQIDVQMAILLDTNTSQVDKCDAAKKLLEINQTLSGILKDNMELAERKAEEFKASSEAYADSNTANESAVIDDTLELYKECATLCEENIATMNEILELDRNGYELEISGQENLRGDFSITTEATKQITAQDISKVTDGVPAKEQQAAETELVNAQEKYISETLEEEKNSPDR